MRHPTVLAVLQSTFHPNMRHHAKTKTPHMRYYTEKRVMYIRHPAALMCYSSKKRDLIKSASHNYTKGKLQ